MVQKTLLILPIRGSSIAYVRSVTRVGAIDRVVVLALKSARHHRREVIGDHVDGDGAWLDG